MGKRLVSPVWDHLGTPLVDATTGTELKDLPWGTPLGNHPGKPLLDLPVVHLGEQSG